jgi:hypothetical protein
MSKRCELQKEYYQAKGNYKGNGKYSDEYVSWLEEQILALRIHDVVGRSEQLVCSCGSRLVKTTGGYHCGNAKCST